PCRAWNNEKECNFKLREHNHKGHHHSRYRPRGTDSIIGIVVMVFAQCRQRSGNSTTHIQYHEIQDTLAGAPEGKLRKKMGKQPFVSEELLQKRTERPERKHVEEQMHHICVHQGMG